MLSQCFVSVRSGSNFARYENQKVSNRFHASSDRWKYPKAMGRTGSRRTLTLLHWCTSWMAQLHRSGYWAGITHPDGTIFEPFPPKGLHRPLLCYTRSVLSENPLQDIARSELQWAALVEIYRNYADRAESARNIRSSQKPEKGWSSIYAILPAAGRGTLVIIFWGAWIR